MQTLHTKPMPGLVQSVPPLPPSCRASAPPRVWRYYRDCLRRSFNPAWSVANNVSLLVGIMVGVALWKLPQVRGSAEQLLWIVPSCACGTVFAYRLARAPFELH